MKDTPTSQTSSIQDEHTHTATQLSDTQQHHHQNDVNKNIIMVDDDGDGDGDDDGDNNQNILSTSDSITHHSNSQKSSSQMPKTTYIEDDGSPAKTTSHSDSDSNEMTGSMHNETPLPDWIALNESVLIRPYNHSGVVSFIGPTHFSVRKFVRSFFFVVSLLDIFKLNSKCN